MRLAPVPVRLLPDAMPDLVRWLGPNAEGPGATPLPELIGMVERREGQLLALLDDDGLSRALGVTQVRDYEAGHRSCWILNVGGGRVGGRPDVWAEVLQEIETGARRNGCAFVEFVGRPAWKRLLPHYRAEACETGTHYMLDLRN